MTAKRSTKATFQFYCSPIQTLRTAVVSIAHRFSFNSTVVRFKLTTKTQNDTVAAKFQFYCSPIQTLRWIRAMQRAGVFQFYCSPIQTILQRLELRRVALFQFYCSPIQTFWTLAGKTRKQSFNSTVVRFKRVRRCRQ